MPSRPKRRNGEDHEEIRTRSCKSWGPAVSTLSSGVSLLLGVAQTAMLLRLEGSDKVLEAQTLHAVTALEFTLSELVELRRDLASWRARAPPDAAVQEQTMADIDIEIEDASYAEPDPEPREPWEELRFEAESWDPNCFDVRTTGLSLECKDLGPHCGKGSSAPAIRAMCPRACNVTCDDSCRDLEFTTFQEPDGSMSSCRHLRQNCQDWESGERVRRICPVTCGVCPGAPLSPPGLEEEAIFRLLTNGTKALERALRSTGAKSPRYLHRIPPILHQTWKTDLIPAKYGADISSWLRLHPTWRYEFWDDARGAALVLDEFPEYAAAFKQMSGIKRADVVRIVALHEPETSNRSLLVFAVVDVEPVDDEDE
ncbi:Inositol phosphoceramide mannosyltransferase 3 [Symbiodinium microadriaticum]|uniref:Inositol phosphoceramide mannosyltransferase 3 n=1 Tax=Symbiodinium microadriaticum TaxID=2951 RepID=A0A1Q9C3I7_SYMMI|nr:Inositol phosphoceramide mannosyltransferase 3 [Symbiodinium microadriaticum]